MNEEQRFLYFIIRNRRQILVSREEWEQDWLNWWASNNISD
jgi:hypothetical protein